MFHWLQRRLHRNDEGFTMVELIVTMVIIATVLISLIGLQISSYATVGQAKQRQQATALANQAIEQLRALPYDTVAGGLYSGDLAGDPNISGADFKPSYDNSIDEPLVTSNNQGPAPLYPHVAHTTVGRIPYTLSAYVSLAGADATSGYWLTAIVEWSTTATGSTPKSVAVRSRMFSPSGCLSTADHPFSGPCQTFFHGNGSVLGGAITLTPSVDGSNLVSGMDASAANIFLTHMSSTVQSEQVLSAQANATTSGGEYKTLLADEQWYAVGAATAADADPGTGKPSADETATASQIGSVPGSPSSANGWSLTMSAGTSDAASSASTLSADGTNSCEDTSGTAVSSEKACASASYTPGAVSAVLNGPGPGNIVLAQVGSAATSRSFSTIYSTAGGSFCPTVPANSDGCIHAGSTASVGTVTAGGLGSGAMGLTPNFGTSLVKVSNYAVQAAAESGVGTTPFTPALAGTLTYWKDSTTGYATVDLSTLAGAGASYNIGTATSQYSNGITVTADGVITVTAATTTQAGDPGCTPTACSLDVSSGAVILALHYVITNGGGGTIADFVTTVNLGAASAHTYYRTASSA